MVVAEARQQRALGRDQRVAKVPCRPQGPTERAYCFPHIPSLSGGKTDTEVLKIIF